MKTSLSLLALATIGSALPSGAVEKRAVKLSASENVFKTYTLHPNSFFKAEVEAAVQNLSDKSLATAAKKVGDVGSFLWL